MIVNGHHRWAAAMLRQKPYIEVKIVNLTHEADVKKMLSKTKNDKRVALDLDEVVFGKEGEDNLEKKLPFPFNYEYKQRLRSGIPALFHYLTSHDYDIWVYTSSFRSESYIKGLFRCYGVKFDGIVNGNRHLKEVQKDSKTILPQKIPSRYRISLHVDDETVICSWGREYGFDTYQLEAQDDDWKDKIIARAAEIRAKRDAMQRS